VYIDENGDAAGNYTVLVRGTVRNIRNQTVLGLMPAGTFSHKSFNSSNSSNNDALPVSNPWIYRIRVCFFKNTLAPFNACPNPLEAGKRFWLSKYTSDHIFTYHTDNPVSLYFCRI